MSAMPKIFDDPERVGVADDRGQHAGDGHDDARREQRRCATTGSGISSREALADAGAQLRVGQHEQARRTGTPPG